MRKRREKSYCDILKACPGDARGILEVNYRAWLDSYPSEDHGITVDDIEDRFKSSFTKEELKRREELIRDSSDGLIRLVAKKDQEIVGFINVEVGEEGNRLSAIYIMPNRQRKGLGQLLWEEANKYLDPKKRTVVHVASYNSKAIDFYKKLGFEETGRVWKDERFKMKSGNSFPLTELILPPKV